jgi:uncharacterized protein
LTTPSGERAVARHRRRRLPRILLWSAIVIVALAVVGFLGVGWYYSDQIQQDLLTPSHGPPDYETAVFEVTEDSVVLERNDDSLQQGIYGLAWPNGYGQVGELIEQTPQRVTRRFRALEGSLAPGDHVAVESTAFSGDPLQARGIEYRPVEYRSDRGSFPAWFVNGEEETWAVFVHGGVGATREEALRMLPTVVEMGLPCLVITYRNDQGVPASTDGLYHYGDEEWRDLEGALRYAGTQGARDFILVGYSAGAGIVTSLLTRSDLASAVRGAIFDSPLLDVEAAVDLEGRNRGLPGFLTSFAKWLSTIRFGVDWESWDRTEEILRVGIPILLIHGTADDVTPIEVSDRLAAARPGLVTYERVPGAGHVRSWNVDPRGYERAVRDYLNGILERAITITSVSTSKAR